MGEREGLLVVLDVYFGLVYGSLIGTGRIFGVLLVYRKAVFVGGNGVGDGLQFVRRGLF